ncbi:AMP-dependent synthetase/ligase [Thermoflavimicrobium dichotomicum]|uniref:Long-chain acyl-CoA synthetase n=1 Tax=Thermoflavimicrobium dichotomicum TaxID=46223 RepID=A0A1I3JAV0_9BACL|nr:AMP-binding protein [Thermoflavimicrobium dichotomicum]SFI57363.1 long-chain acyl-CoA synthetase [Thermoflavimicrobium dichotomicum]
MKPHNLLEMLAQSVKHNPCKIALKWIQDGSEQQMTYQKLWNIIRDFAMGLEKIGVRSGTKVAIFANNGPRWLISDLAILSLGAISVPIAPTLPPEHVLSILKDAEVTTIIIENPELFNSLTNLSQLTKHQILMAKHSQQAALSFETVLQIGQTISFEEEEWVYHTIQSSDPATLLYPTDANEPIRGALLSHGHILTNIQSSNHVIPISNEDLSLSLLTFAHPFSRIMGYFRVLYHGATIIFANQSDKILPAFQQVQPTILVGTSSLYESINREFQSEIEQASWIRKKRLEWAIRTVKEYYKMSHGIYNWPIHSRLAKKYGIAKWLILSKWKEKVSRNLRIMLSTGIPLPEEICQFFTYIGIPLIESYSLSECTAMVACNHLSQIRPGTAGTAIPGVDLRLASDGELLVKSPSTMMGYYNQPEETAKKIVNGWVYTGQLAEIDANGYLRILGQK